MMDRMLLGMRQEVAKLGHMPTPEDLEKISKKINSGKITPTFVPQTPAEKAQEICFQARSARGRRIVHLARQALSIDPNCCDAMMIMAERLSADQSKIPLLQKAVEVFERQVGPAFFEENTGHFWGMTETRPYMRARTLLAEELLQEDQLPEGIAHLQKLLELNPGDNQGNRYLLADAYLSANRLDELDELLNKSDYHDESSPEWEYTRTLLAYRRHGDGPAAREQLTRALKENEMVAKFLTRAGGPRNPSHADEPPYEIQEAMNVARMISSGWEEAEGALDWLKAMTAPIAGPKKQKKR
jgi:tetratricopeptide (TPR) repeat protein